jgi:septum formation protein
MAEHLRADTKQAGQTPEQVVLASGSGARAALLRAAGVSFEILPAHIDEAEAKRSLRAEGADGAAMAQMLAELKAAGVSRQRTARLVIGADQVLECDGRTFDKPADRNAAANQLRDLRGREHHLFTCAVIYRDQQRLWHHLSKATLAVRPFGDEFLEEYLDAIGDAALSGPGAYQLEGLGAQLFTRIDGDYFSILGLPLIAVLDYLRVQGALRT